ncbi:MAG: U32 family peptidase [Coriobacteriales bacterium]|nr:U32 family peptidase [Coriobacteriales bacterium]
MLQATHMPELLAPAGGPPQFNAAIAAGANAIYCGFGNTFNARRGAQSFTSKTFGEACDRAHVAGVRVYVTVNVAIRADEMPSVLALVRRAWLLGADAFIIQDWGLLHEVRKRWPNIECHVSTQANVHDTRGVAWCRERGAQRVTLSRELSLQEIEQIAKEGVDLECFGHGAICICYSGICMMSSTGGNRSANRGACAQPCRLPYELVDKDGVVLSAPDRGRPLCPRDFYAFDDLAAFARAGVASLKVEGRLKGADYITSVISTYRAQLDDLARGVEPPVEALEERRTRLKRAFNRDFTNAYLKGTSGDELMSYERSNNRGELVGAVVGGRSFGSVKVRRGGAGGGRERLRTAKVAEVDIALDKPVGKGDLLEVRPVGNPSQFLTTHAEHDAKAGEVIRCKTTRVLQQGSLVRVIRSQSALDAGARASSGKVLRRRPVNVRVLARMGQPFEVELATVDGCASAVARGFVVEQARTRAVSKEDLIEHVGRMGTSEFEPVSFEVQMDEGCGMGFSAVHEVRAQACELLRNALLEPYKTRELAAAPSRETVLRDLSEQREQRGASPSPSPSLAGDTPLLCAIATSAEAAHAAVRAGAQRVYAPSDALGMGTWPQGVVPVLDEVCREADHVRLDAWVRAQAPVAVGNVSELALAATRGALPEVRGCVPVHNESCLTALEEAGAAGVWLSPELSFDEIKVLAQWASVPLGVVVLGRTRAMTTEHCVLQVANRCVHDCGACKLRKQSTFLRDDKGNLFPVRTDEHGRSRVYAAQPLDITPQVGMLAEAGVSRLAVDGTLMTTQELEDAVRYAARALEAWRNGKRPAQRRRGHTAGHLFEPIE